jgi:hypothetical protein
MTDQNLNTNPILPTEPITPSPRLSLSSINWKLLPGKIKPILKTAISKFYSNKKLFWPIVIATGLILLLTLAGLLFGTRGSNQNTKKTPTPSPFVQSTPQASASGNILIDSQSKLNDLKNQINALDVKQSRLKLPTLNFDIKF